jgi:diguanylate cyclase (GGDEF)-like protein
MDTFPAVHAAANTWGGAAAMLVFLAAVFCYSPKHNAKHAGEISADRDGKGSGVPFVVGLGTVHYMIMCMNSYIECEGDSISSLAFGFGAIVSLGMVFVIQMLMGRSALYIWMLFLVLSLLGLGALLYDTPTTVISGSFAYGLGDSLGYIIISYMCAGAIKRSKSQRMFRLYCLVSFLQYFIISGVFAYYVRYYDGPDRALAFGVELVLICFCLLFMPLIQKRLFEADWTDGLYLRDMVEYSRPLAETKEISTKDHLELTPREQEIFTMLLTGTAPKEIAYTLKISYDTVHFHQKNLYRKLGIQSRAELFARYSSKIEHHDSTNRKSADMLRLNELNKKLIDEIDKLESLIITDELTKINNKRSFLEYMNLIWEHCRSLGLQINAIMIDVDNFKKYNDSLGHLEGDKALIAIAQCLKSQLKRETDFVARFGGEEFVCLLPFIEKDEALAFAKSLVQSVENMNIPHPKNDASKYLTISAGMANIVPTGSNTSGQLLDMADKALYAAKKSGRNRAAV